MPWRNDGGMLVRLGSVLTLLIATHQDPNASLTTFQNFNRTFQLELPTGWRQIAPNEAVRLSEQQGAPFGLHPAQPSLLYTVGPIEEWLAGDFSSPWLRVIERKDEWYIQEDYEQTIRDNWARQSDSSGTSHEVEGVTLEKLGPQEVECVIATRTTTPAATGKPVRSLDVHAPTAQQQIILSFSCPVEEFHLWKPEFQRWLKTLTFARVAQEPATLSDRLWTPILVGGAVGIVLLLLYKHTRSQR